jgi:hypothetical protein
VTHSCPFCGNDIDAVDLQQPGGVGGGTYCPNCHEQVYVSFAYPRLVAIISLFMATGAMLLMKVASVFWFVVGTAMLWIPISLFLNAYSSRFKPPTLKKWRPRTRRTFFELLYERDEIRAPKMPDPNDEDHTQT